MRIEAIREWDLDAGDEAAIAALLASAFDTDFGGRSFFMQRHALRIVARDPDIVGHLALCQRAVRQGEELIDVVGLADVATAPGRQGEGIAGTLLRAAIDEARKTRAAFFILFGDAGVYSSNGFTPEPTRVRYLDMTGAVSGAIVDRLCDDLMVLSLSGRRWDRTLGVDLLGHLI